MLRSVLICLASAALAACSGTPSVQPVAPAPAEDVRILPYAKPGLLVDVGGRRINLMCAGKGSPTVIEMAGLSGWSAVWYKVQPEIAKRTRVCGFDRAAYGFSDPPLRPQIMPDVVSDLHAALTAANVPGPYVLMGHSLGGPEARLFTQRWPQEVVGMVLVDTSLAGDLLIMADEPESDQARAGELEVSTKLTCILKEARGQLKPSDPLYPECSLVLPSDTPAAFRKIAPRFWTADYAAAQLSQMSSVRTHRYDSIDHLDLGEMPLVVLSADVTGYGSSFWDHYSTKWFAQHEALAHLSSRGVHRIIKGARHEIQLDKPEEIIGAVDEVLRRIPAG